MISSVLLSSIACAQNIRIRGAVSDKQTGELLAGAHIYFPLQKRGATSDSTGEFGLYLPHGERCDIIVIYVGYSVGKISFISNSDTLIHVLLEQDNRLNDITVYGSRANFGVQHSQMSAIGLPIARINYVPAIMGEVDVLKALQTLPGVQSAADGNAGIYVRGGGYDQNQITLDGATLYSAEHLRGLVSAINPDMVRDLVFYKGAFPARYGGQLSSVVDIAIKDGDMDKLHSELTIGALSSKIQIEGPLRKNTTSFNIAARASYLDLLVVPVLNNVVENKGLSSVYAELNYFDVSAKLVQMISRKHKLSVSFYKGKDWNKEAPSEGFDGSSIEYKDNSVEGLVWRETTDKKSNSYKVNNWGNMLGSVIWVYTPSNRVSMGMSYLYSKYDYYLKQSDSLYTKLCKYSEKEGEGFELKQTVVDEILKFTEFYSGIEEYSTSFNISCNIHDKHNIRSGYKVVAQNFSPQVHPFQKKCNHIYDNYGLQSSSEQITDVVLGKGTENAVTTALFVEDDITIGRVRSNIGIRYMFYNADGANYHFIEPRVSARYLLRDNMSLKVSYSRMTQGVHLLSATNLVAPSDIWVPITKEIAPMKSDQFALGANCEIKKGFEFSLEGYYKSMKNLLEYREGASFFDGGERWNEMVSLGEGKAYGVEFYMQKDVGSTTGWISYTWSKSIRLFNRSGEELNGGKPFYSGADRRNNLNIVLNHKFCKWFDVSMLWTYQTGRRGTLVTSSILGGVQAEKYLDPHAWKDGAGFTYAGIYPYYVEDNIWGGYMPFNSYREKNGIKLPDSHRLDVSMNFHIFHNLGNRGGESIINVSVHNVYNRMNINNLYWTYSGEDKAMGQELVLKGVCILPIMPSISYTLKF